MSGDDLSVPVHPGEILFDEFLAPMRITACGLANALGVSSARIYQIIAGRQGITADTALRLARYFGTSELFWTNLQTEYALRMARRSDGKAISRITPLSELRDV